MQIQNKVLPLHQQTNTTTMETILNTITAQATELLKNENIQAMLNECKTEEEKRMKLAIASIYSLTKANN